MLDIVCPLRPVFRRFGVLPTASSGHLFGVLSDFFGVLLMAPVEVEGPHSSKPLKGTRCGCNEPGRIGKSMISAIT